MGNVVMPPTFCSLRTSLLGLGCVSLFLALGCSNDDADPGNANLGGSTGSGSNQGGSSGAAGSGGSGGSNGSAGTAGTAGSGGTGTAGSGGSGAGGSSGEADAGTGADAGDAGPQEFVLTSTAFDNNAGCGPGGAAGNCDLFPNDNTRFGANVSPQFAWSGAPAGTQSFVLALHDLSAPFGHWVVWNIPASATGLPAAFPRGEDPGVPAQNTHQVGFDDNAPETGYEGSGACGNVYEFVLYALSAPTFEPVSTDSPGAVRAELEASDDVIDTVTMRGRSDPNGANCN